MSSSFNMTSIISIIELLAYIVPLVLMIIFLASSKYEWKFKTSISLLVAAFALLIVSNLVYGLNLISYFADSYYTYEYINYVFIAFAIFKFIGYILLCIGIYLLTKNLKLTPKRESDTY